MALYLYLRFVVFLALGLAGLGFVLVTLIDRFLSDREIVAAIAAFARRFLEGPALVPAAGRTEDAAMVSAESPRNLSTRLLDKRREQLQEINEVESRLGLSRATPGSSSRSALYQEDWV